MAHAAGYNSARSTVRSTGVHEVHRHRTVDRLVDRCRKAVDRPVDRLKGAKSRLETVDRRGRPAGRPTDRPTDAFSAVLYRFRFLFWLGSNSIGVS